MANLSFKYLLKRGVKEIKNNLLKNIVSVLLCTVCGTLLAYSDLFFSFDVSAVEARTVSNLDEESYKYASVYSNDESVEASSLNGRYTALSAVAFAYLDETVPYLKYTNFEMSGSDMRSSSYGSCADFCVTISADDLLDYGYTFYGDYAKSLSDGEVYISDTYLKDGIYYLYEDGKWEEAENSDNADTSDEWFSAFVGREIYLEEMEGAKVKIAGVVNTGAYSLSFRDIGLTGEDDYGNKLKEQRKNALNSYQASSIGRKIYCSEEFLRSYIVTTGRITIGGEFDLDGFGAETIKEDFSVGISGENTSYTRKGKKVGLSNTVSSVNLYNRQLLCTYADDKGIHIPYAFSTEEMPITPFEYEVNGIMNYADVASESDICGAGEIMISDGLYKKLYDEDYVFNEGLPSHIGEKISVTITVDGKTYEIKDKTLVGVLEAFGFCDAKGDVYGIICPEDEMVNEFMADYITMYYVASVNISGLSDGELKSLIGTLDNKYNVVVNAVGYYAATCEEESIGNTKNIYLIISAVLLVMSLLFGAWNVLHTVKRDYREIGILRANGVTARDMAAIYAVQFILGGIISFALSLIGLNVLTAIYVPSDRNVIRNMLYFPEIVLYWVGARQVLLLLAISVVVPLLVSLFAFFRVRKISPVEAINEAKRNE